MAASILTLLAQVVLLGKCAAALLLANAAYLSVDKFKEETSLHDVEYLFDKRTDTHVSAGLQWCLSPDSVSC